MGTIRLLLAISVILNHTDAPFVMAGGRFSVQMFYMISGFLIAHVLRTKPAYSDTIKFYTARWLRIWPPYIVVAAVVLGLFVLEGDRLRQFELLPGGLRLFMAAVNLTLFGQDWTNFIASPPGVLPLHKFLLVPQAWTLGLELTFYLLAPFLLRRPRLMIGTLVVSLAARAGTAHFGLTADPWSYRFFPFELALFLLGAASYRWFLPIATRAPPRAPPLITALAITMVLMSDGMPIIEPVKSVLIFLGFAGALPFLFAFQKGRRWDVLAGELSYPVYLTHWAVAMVALEVSQRLGVGRPSALPVIVTVGALVGAIALDLMVIRPVERFRARLSA